MEILYKVHNNLYVNLTNKCPYSCTFCLRQTMDRIGESGRLWLEREPSYDEVIAEFEKFNMDEYEESYSADSENRQKDSMFLSRLLSMSRKHMAKRQESILTELEILLMAETLCQRWKA
ncbi:MAG: hypothetical protein ACLRMX_04460 [Lachnospira eligens]